jgi:flagellar hook-associated protein 1 FlgK
MNLTSAFSNALSGLSATSRAAQVVSSNIANASTEGYAARNVGLVSQSLGGNGAGVQITGVFRETDPGLIADRRLSQAELGNASVFSEFLGELEQSIGIPEDVGSLNHQVAAFEAALLEASSRPDSIPRLDNVLTAAKDVTQKLGQVSSDIQKMRGDADQEIGAQVNFLNDTLTKLEDLNRSIKVQTTSGRDATALMDQRQVLVDQISEIIPLREIQQEHNTIALYTKGGAALLDVSARQFEFTTTNTIVPEMTLASGALSGLSLNGEPINLASERNAIAGGSLSALFEVRDDVAVAAQADLDAVARSLMERFADPSVDGTAVGGLFTDGGAVFDPLTEVALSSRLEIAAAADPDQGGEVWRLRDGLGAVTQGDVGDATIFQAMLDTLSAPITPASGGFSSATRSFNDLSADFLSSIGVQKQSKDVDVSYSAAKTEALQFQENAMGVDSDQEMQKLLVVERSYAANAKVIQAVDQMLDLLMGL